MDSWRCGSDNCFMHYGLAFGRPSQRVEQSRQSCWPGPEVVNGHIISHMEYESYLRQRVNARECVCLCVSWFGLRLFRVQSQEGLSLK